MNNMTVINGRKRLHGELKVQGAKNSVLPILAAAVISGGESVIHNCPAIKDVYASFSILRELGCSARLEGGTAVINSENMCCDEICEGLMREMRSSVIFSGAVLARCKKAFFTSPGGCELGPRPIDLHLKAFRALGVKVDEMSGFIACDGEDAHGGEVFLDFPSVGATENVMLLASVLPGETVIKNAAREPEITDLQNYLNSAGGEISGAGSDVIVINGVKKLHGCTHTVIGDRIAAATYLFAAAVTSGELSLTGLDPETVLPMLEMLECCGCEVNRGSDCIKLKAKSPLRGNLCISTKPYPGFPTDAQAPAAAVLCVTDGVSIIEENIFSGRFKYTDELIKLGADITVNGKTAVIRGKSALCGGEICAPDLRGAAALAIAGLCADGTTVLTGLEHLDRGYEHFEQTLCSLGADVKRI